MLWNEILIVSSCNNILVHVITYYNYKFLKNDKKKIEV